MTRDQRSGGILQELLAANQLARYRSQVATAKTLRDRWEVIAEAQGNGAADTLQLPANTDGQTFTSTSTALLNALWGLNERARKIRIEDNKKPAPYFINMSWVVENQTLPMGYFQDPGGVGLAAVGNTPLKDILGGAGVDYSAGPNSQSYRGALLFGAASGATADLTLAGIRYDQSVTGEVPKSIENYELWIQTYPRDWTPRNNVSGDYQDIGEFQKAVVQGLECLRLQPNDVLPYQVVMGAYIRLNQLEEAKSIYKQAVDKKLDGMVVHSQRFAVAYLEGDAQEMERQAAWASGKPEESIILLQKAQVAASRGQLKKARELSEQAFDSARKFDLQSSAAAVAAWRGIFENWLGDSSAARSWSTQALDLSHDQLVWPAAMLALAGDSARPQIVADTAAKRHPKNTDLQQNWIPQVRAAIEIRRANPAAAVAILKPAELLEANDIGPTFYRGLAYFSQKSANEAAAEFKKVVDRKNIFPLAPLHPMSRLYLARSLALAGDTAGARSAYQDLFALWKDADPDLPLLKQAKDEYARLH